MTDALVSLPPQRPPPPNRTTSPVGVMNPVSRRPPENEDQFRIVDARTKSKQKPQSLSNAKQKSGGKLLRSDSASPDHGFTLIDSKNSPLLAHNSSSKTPAPPPRPQPPTRPDLTSEKSVSSDACDSGAPSEPQPREEPCVKSGASDSREGEQLDPVVVERPSSAKVSQPPPRPQQPPMRQRSNTVTSNGSHGSANEDRHNSPERKQAKNEPVRTEPKNEDTDNSNLQRVRPSRPPPPPRSKSVPRAKSLTEHKQKRLMRERSPTIDVTAGSGHNEVLHNRAASTKSPHNHPTPRSPASTTPPSISPPPTTPTRVPPHPQSNLLIDLTDEAEVSVDNQKQDKASVNIPLDSKPPVVRPAVRSPPPPPSRSPESAPTRHVIQSPTQSPVTDQPPLLTPQENLASEESLSKPELTPPDTPADASGSSATNSLSTASSPPAIPNRPYLPPRPFPPRPNSGSKRAPAKPKRSPQHSGRKVVKAQTAMSLSSKKRSHDHATVTHNPTPPVRSPVSQSSDKRAVMESVEVSQAEVDAHVSENLNTPTLSITDHDVVQFGFPPDLSEELSPTSPNYDSSVPATVDVSASLPSKLPNMVRENSLEGLAEERTDEVAELQPIKPSSPGGKFFQSMKKSFKSLRLPRKPSRDIDELSPRRHSDTSTLKKSATLISNKDYPDPLPQGIIEPLVVKCVAYLNREEVLLEPGLFRIPGDLAAVRKLRTAFLTGVDVDLEEVLDPHTVCGLLKLHFREMRVSMIPRGEPLVQLIQNVKQRNVEGVRDLMNTMDMTHIATLRLVTEVLSKVVAHSDVNRMTAGTLATSCGPSMFPYLPASNANQLLKFIVDHCEEIFAT